MFTHFHASRSIRVGVSGRYPIIPPIGLPVHCYLQCPFSSFQTCRGTSRTLADRHDLFRQHIVRGNVRHQRLLLLRQRPVGICERTDKLLYGTEGFQFGCGRAVALKIRERSFLMFRRETFRCTLPPCFQPVYTAASVRSFSCLLLSMWNTSTYVRPIKKLKRGLFFLLAKSKKMSYAPCSLR